MGILCLPYRNLTEILCILYAKYTHIGETMNSIKSQQNSQKQDIVYSTVPYIQKLLMSKKISMKEKLSVLEDVNIDIAAYLMSIG